jgi:peroxiredoxin
MQSASPTRDLGTRVMPPRAALLTATAITGVLAGCGWGDLFSTGSSGEPEIRFNDDAVANASPGEPILNLEFTNQAGKTIRPRDFVGKQNLVVVFVKGYNGSICPYCSAYTSGLISNFKAINERKANVLLVYPITRPDQSQRLEEFLKATYERSQPAVSQTPFPVVLDVGLKAVDALGIRKDLAKPATYILDKQGHVRFAYVGSSLSDRPSIKVILKQLDAIQQEPG